jgi:hypothetical protein
MRKRAVFFTIVLITSLAMCAVYALAQTTTNALSDCNAAPSQGKTNSEFRLNWLLSRAAQRRVGATLLEFSLMPSGTGYANPGSKAVALRAAPMADAPSVKGSGTPGQIPIWLDSRTIGDSVITELNGNIGIGTTTPISKLTVKGELHAVNAGLSGNAVVAQGGFGSIGGHGGGAGVSAFGGDGNGGFGGVGVFASGGNAGAAGNQGGDGIVAHAGVGLVGATAGRAGFFDGDVEVTGTLTKSGGSFKIDHPLDPENKYLSHSFVESPDMLNVYNGNIALDRNGEAVVQLPDYFEVLNQDFRYQLTAIGAPGPDLYIAQEIKGNQFKIAGGAAGIKVSWQVTGIRKDPWAERHRIAVEQEKPERERGHYLYPELYDQAEERGVEWARHPELMRRMKESRARKVEEMKRESSKQ